MTAQSTAPPAQTDASRGFALALGAYLLWGLLPFYMKAVAYLPLTEVVADQHVFELADVEGTMLGFRFPSYAEGIEVGGYHLHFISADRDRGGHVLGSRTGELRVRIDPSDDLHVELPPEVELEDPELAAETHAAVEAVERG